MFNQPAEAFIVGQLEDVTNIRYFAPVATSERLSSAAFTAWIDLAGVTVDPAATRSSRSTSSCASPIPPSRSSTTGRAGSPSVSTRSSPGRFPSRSPTAPSPKGSSHRRPELAPQTVDVSGPQSVVNQVVAAEARVGIQPSGIDVDQLVDLIAVDARGEQLTPVEIEPSAVRVRIEVSSDITTRTVPVVADRHRPAGGRVRARVDDRRSPAWSRSRATPTCSRRCSTAPTVPISIEGATENVTLAAELDLPEGVTAVVRPP